MKNVIVTGAAGGIGREIVKQLVKRGNHVFACARTERKDFSNYIEELNNLNNGGVTPVYFDFTSSDSIRSGFKQIQQARKTIDILINNAGMIHNALFMMTSMETMRLVLENNFLGPMHFTQLIIKLMLRNQSGNKSIINISSTAGIDCNPGKLTYGCSKNAFIVATKVLAQELADYGIRVNSVAPSMTKTPMLEHDMSVEVQQQELRRKCIKRLGEVRDVVDAILFLASEEASYITGQVLRIDGGVF